MCTVVILRRPGHPRWPALIAANRDEMMDRPWRPPARHWTEQPGVRAGLDELGGGTWLGINDAGVVCCVLNRLNTLGPAAGLRSRGELPLIALDHDSADAAAEAICGLPAGRFRPFNMVIADAGTGLWLRARAEGGAGAAATRIEALPVPDGVSIVTAYDLNDTGSPRIRRYLDRFRAAAAPDPDTGDWDAWVALLAARDAEPGAGPGGAMMVETATGFGTVCASLIALRDHGVRPRAPIWLFSAGPPDRVSFVAVG